MHSSMDGLEVDGVCMKISRRVWIVAATLDELRAPAKDGTTGV